MTTSSLLTGVAEHLAHAGAGTWRTTGAAYTAGETAIVQGKTPATPDRVIALAAYPVEDEPELPISVLGVQVRVRGTPDARTADDIADRVFDELHGLTNTVLGGVPVVQILRRSSTPLGQDQSGRWERSDNYYFTVQRPGRNRPES